jgi:hypothetical protein
MRSFNKRLCLPQQGVIIEASQMCPFGLFVVSSGFRERFFLMSLCFVMASVPRVWGLYQRRR